jgi:putative aldouronate transport system substrate-binding protein
MKDGGNNADNLIKGGTAGFYIGNRDEPYRDTPGIFTNLRQNIPGALIEPINPFTNAQGKTPKEIYDAVGIYSFIPAFSKEPEAAMRYLNWLARFENRYFLQTGPAGITHDVVDGIPKLKAATGLWIMNSDQNLDYTLPINGLDLGDPAKNTKSIVNAFNADYSQLIERAYALSLKDGKAPPVVPVTLTLEGQYQAVLGDKQDRLLVSAITCPPGNFDQVWEEGIKDYLASGGQAVIDERKAKYIAP